MHAVIPYVIAAVLFGLGCYGVLVRRNAVLLLMSVELMLNGVNLVLVTADTTVKATLPHSGGVFALFVIVLAAAEIGVGLAIVLQFYRLRHSVHLDAILLDSAPQDTATVGSANGDPAVVSAGRVPVPRDAGGDLVGSESAGDAEVDGSGEVVR